MKLPFEVDAQGVPLISFWLRVQAAWYVLLGRPPGSSSWVVLLGRPVAFRVCITGLVAPAGHHVRVYGCKIDSGGLPT